jgi:hypothetical protein
VYRYGQSPCWRKNLAHQGTTSDPVKVVCADFFCEAKVVAVALEVTSACARAKRSESVHFNTRDFAEFNFDRFRFMQTM